VKSAQVSARSRWTFAAVSTALFCVQIDYFAMNLALPRMAQDLGSDTTNLQWVISVYMLALGAFMTPAGRIGDIFGRRRALLAGIALFGVASVLCALAPWAGMVIAFRALQGLGAALIFPVSVSADERIPRGTRRSCYRNGLRHSRIGQCRRTADWWPADGDGWLAGNLLAQCPIHLAVLRHWGDYDRRVLRHLGPTANRRGRSGPDRVRRRAVHADVRPRVHVGLTSPATFAALIGSVLLLAAVVVVERRVRWPFVDLSLIRNGRFTILVVAGAVANVAYAVTIYLSTMNLQQVRGLDPLTAGLAFLGASAGAALGGVLAGWLAARKRPMQVPGARLRPCLWQRCRPRQAGRPT
jgi:MFS family permease